MTIKEEKEVIIVGFTSQEQLNKYVKARIAKRSIQRAVCKALFASFTTGLIVGMVVSSTIIFVLK